MSEISKIQIPQTNGMIKLDDSIELDTPTIIIQEMIFRPIEKMVLVSLLFTGDKYSISRRIPPFEYQDDWSVAEVQKHIFDFVTAVEITKEDSVENSEIETVR